MFLKDQLKDTYQKASLEKNNFVLENVINRWAHRFGVKSINELIVINLEQINLKEEDHEEENQEQINLNNENSSFKRIGNLIKEARISRNQSVEQLASDLKMGTHQLRAIEEGNENILPEKVFIKAMVRRISEKLKIDTEFIMTEFRNERKEVKIKEITKNISIKDKKNRSIKNKNLMVFIVFIFISGILGLLASSLIFNFVSDIFEEKIPQKELINKN